MAKNITDKYEMEFDMAECGITTPFKLSKTEFKKRFALAMKKVEESKDFDAEFQITYFTKEYEFDSYTVTRHYFNNGMADVTFVEYHCKDGYRFTK